MLEKGMVFKDEDTGTLITIEETDNYMTKLRLSDGTPMYGSTIEWYGHLMNNFTLIEPLTSVAEKSNKHCTHKNIREDRFFSAMVYQTCKDCGKTLN